MRKYLACLIPLCTALLIAAAPGEPAHKQRSIDSCLAALEKSGHRPREGFALKARFTGETRILVSGKLSVGDPGIFFVCETRHNNVISIRIGKR